MEIAIKQGDITQERVDAIVHPANSHMTMGGGLAKVIRERGGEEIKREVQKYVPVPVGNAVCTSAGKLAARFIIHAPTMEHGSQPTTIGNVRAATLAVLRCAEENNLSSIAIPGLGTGVGQVPKEIAAETIVRILLEHQPRSLKKIVLVDANPELIGEFEHALKKLS